MIEKYGKIIGGIVSIVAGIQIIQEKQFYMHGGYVDFSSPLLHLPIGSFFIFMGLYFLYAVFIKKDNSLE